MNEIVEQNEVLYRVIKRSRPDTMDEYGRPTSALFKQDNGVSVDRDGGRTELEIIGRFKEYFNQRFKGLVCFGADVCIDNDMAVIPNPTDNDYHAEIFDDYQKTPLSQLKALILADSCKIVAFENDVAWTKL